MISFNKSNLDMFWYYVFERQNIWKRRFIEKIPFPWTNDKILRDCRFTNVYRELDNGTIYLRNNILDTEEREDDKIFNVMIYRLIGKSYTHQKLGFQKLYSFKRLAFQSMLKYIRDQEKIPPFTSAYLVSGYNGYGSHDKIENIGALLEDLQSEFPRFYVDLHNCKSSKEIFERIEKVSGFGLFLSYQILVDLLYTIKNGKPMFPFSHNDWAIAGPGAKRGIRMISNDNEYNVMKWLYENQDSEFIRLGYVFPYLAGNKISLSNIENCLCEFSKYHRILNGGHIKRKYP